MPKPKTPKAQKKQIAQATTPVITDPRLVALLMFINGDNKDDDNNGSTIADYARALADADAMLTSQPLTSAFALYLDRPSMGDFVTRAVKRQAAQFTRPDPCASLMDQVMTETPTASDHEPIAGSRNAWQTICWTYSEQALLRGACLMYRLMAGGAK